MGRLSKAIYESFNIEDNFAEEVAQVADGSVEKAKQIEQQENIEESLTEGTLWDKIAPALQEEMNESLWDDIVKAVPDLNESLNESADTSIEQALDKFYDLTQNKDIPPKRAKAMILGQEEMVESLTEAKLNSSKKTYKEKYDPKRHMKKVVERYIKEAHFPKDTQFTKEMLKNEDWRIKNVAMKAAVPSSALKEALLEGIKNED